MEQNNLKKEKELDIVDLNKPVKIRFSDGEELLITIFEQKPPQQQNSPVFPINKKSPLGKALLGRTKGEQIEYQVLNNKFQVIILKIGHN